MWLQDCFVQSCNRLNGITARIFCLLMVLTQGGIIDYYLITYQNVYSWVWVTFDVLNVGIFTTAFFISNRQLDLEKSGNEETNARVYTLGWFAWLIYSVTIVARVSIAFTRFTFRLDENDFFGPNTLKTSVALAAVVFVFLLMSHHDAPVGTERRAYINDLTGTVIFDVLDTVDILEVLFHKDARDVFLPGLQQTILAVAGINLIIPTIPLITLSFTNFGKNKLSKRMVSLHKLLVVLVVNVPNLLVRLILWHGFSVGISPFMLKNIILIAITTYEFYEHTNQKHTDDSTSEETSQNDDDKSTNPDSNSSFHSSNCPSDFTYNMQERFYEN